MYSLPLSNSIITLLLALIPVALVIMSFWKITKEQAGWYWRGWRTLLPGIGMGVLLALLASGWMRMLLTSGNYLAIPTKISLLDILLLLLLAPVAEEALFRGAVFAGFRRNWHIVWAVMLSALVNLLILPMQQWLAYSFIAAVGYALTFHLSRSLWAAIIAHILVSANLLLLYSQPQFAERYTLPQLLLAALFAAFIIFFSAQRDKNQTE